MQNTPAKPPAKNRFKKLKLTGIASVLGTIAAILAILQFLGVTHIQNLFPTHTPTPVPIIAEPTYDTVSPGCDASKDPSDIVWLLSEAKNTCATNDGGTNLFQTSKQYVPQLLFESKNGHELASNQTISVDLAGIAHNICAGIETRENKKDAAGYALYICGDGNWYILEYTRQVGAPIVLAQSTSETKEGASTQYTLVITVDNSNLQMAINGGHTHTVQNPDYTLTEIASIVMSEVAVLTTYQYSHFLTSITVRNFHYEQI